MAELAIQGVEKGLFFSKSPDFISNFAIASLAGVAPRIFNVALEFVMLPFYFFLHLWIRWNIDKRILAWRAETQVPRRGKLNLLNEAAGLLKLVFCSLSIDCYSSKALRMLEMKALRMLGMKALKAMSSNRILLAEA